MAYTLANPNGKTAQERRGGWNGSSWISKVNRLAIYLRDDFKCAYCGECLKSYKPADVTLDHIKPRSKGGSDEPTNLVTACRKCNKSRFLKSVKDYATGGAYDRIQRLRRRKLNVALAKAIIKGNAGDPRLETR